MGCLFAILAVSFPRLALFFVWLFTPLVYRAFDTFLVPLLGVIFLPFTTLMYVLAYIPGVGLTGWGWSRCTSPGDCGRSSAGPTGRR